MPAWTYSNPGLLLTANVSRDGWPGFSLTYKCSNILFDWRNLQRRRDVLCGWIHVNKSCRHVCMTVQHVQVTGITCTHVHIYVPLCLTQLNLNVHCYFFWNCWVHVIQIDDASWCCAQCKFMEFVKSWSPIQIQIKFIPRSHNGWPMLDQHLLSPCIIYAWVTNTPMSRKVS